MGRNFYAIEHTYGATVQNSTGDHIGEVRVFTSKAERDAWILQGNPYSTHKGAREALSTKSATDRRAIATTSPDYRG